MAGLAAFVYFWWVAGSAVVVDETNGVESAFITTRNGWEQPLRKLWSGYFYAIPQIGSGPRLLSTHSGRSDGTCFRQNPSPSERPHSHPLRSGASPRR